MRRIGTSRPPSAKPDQRSLKRGFKTQAERIAVEVRAELRVPLLAPLDPYRLAKHRGVRVIELALLLDHGFSTEGLDHFEDNPRVFAAYDITGGEPFVLLFGVRARTRRVSDLMHELAHHELRHIPGSVFDAVGCRRWDPVQEDEATWLAGCLLVPADAAYAALKAGLTPQAAAELFGVSVDMFMWRANTTGAFIRLERIRSRRA